MWCMKCGANLPDEARFCFNCGTKVPDLVQKTNYEKEENYYEEFDYVEESENIYIFRKVC
ncbi:zinc-ribbon domain-containing protein [Clostridium isatidis]|uniref:Zinc-ribbon domain-containing protein n=1 Tax=Clostridium isatidis TaxID=182773 RepID=A0A343JCQ1_9CLOT|nr:zinc-ribbon domain-containing protein [Clostridium isatidis]ASW43309.1 hypothetical protein BEN51_07395 [Clostridium isatidis]